MAKGERKQLEEIAALLDEGRLAEALRLAEPLILSTDPEIALMARRQAGIALLHQDEFAAAARHLESAARSTDLTEDWFHLLVASSRAHDFALAEEALGHALRNVDAPPPQAATLPSTPPLSRGWIRYLYIRALCDAHAFARAVAPLEELRREYQELATTDPLVLAEHNLPAFEDLLDAVEAVALGLGPAFDHHRWLSDLARSLGAGAHGGVEALIETLDATGRSA